MQHEDIGKRGVPRGGDETFPGLARRKLQGVLDELKFYKQWATNPKRTGAISPSGKPLARLMAAQIEPRLPGPIVELGPGTGVITQALLERGIEEERLILVEASDEFAAMLKQRFPKARLVKGNAFDIKKLIAEITDEPLCAVVSGLPLFTSPLEDRIRLVDACMDLLGPGGAYIQFSYHVVPPVPRSAGQYWLHGTRRVWWNMFPARVWVYRDARDLDRKAA